MRNDLVGKFVHITGSLPVESTEEDIALARTLVKCLAHETLREGGGLVVLINSGRANSTVPFDWDILEAASEFQNVYRTDRILLRTVRHPRWRSILSEEQRGTLNSLSSNTEDHPPPLWNGGRIRETQADLANAALAIGGGIGVEDTAERLLKAGKPVLPLNFHIPAQPEDAGASKLYSESIRDPKSFMPKSREGIVSQVDSLQVFDDESAQRVSRRIIEMMSAELRGSAGRRILNSMKPVTVIVGRSALVGLTREVISKIL